MKFLLTILMTSSIVAVPIGNVTSVEVNNNIINKQIYSKNNSIQLSPDYSNIIDYLNSIVLFYVRNYYSWEWPWLNDNDVILAQPVIFRDGISTIGESNLTNEQLVKSDKQIIHEETDTLTNNTNQDQVLKSAGFSRKYSDIASHTVTKNFGAELTVPLEYFTFKFGVNVNQTDTKTQTVETTLTAPEQSISVPAHQTRKVEYKVYETRKITNYILNAEVPWLTMIQFLFETNHSQWSPQYRNRQFQLALGDVINNLRGKDLEPSKNNVIYTDNYGHIFINVPIQISWIKNELEVDVS